MTEDQSFQLPPGDNNLLGATSKNGIASGCHDFNKYDPYVDRIRTLFVPSLESRIHSCLETFVYRQESGQRSDPPYLKRCLDAAATLRDPVEAFCTKWRDSGLIETMLASVVKFLISNGPIDCFLNSIVLNNRLNKVCRDLDALGVEKDLLRYLAVWNYINERDYWLEEDNIISTSKSDESRDSVDHPSDLAVEVGSGLDSQRNDRSIRRAFKRRATDDSSDDKNRSSRASQNFPENQRSPVPFPSRLSIDSSNPEGSRSSSVRKKIRTSQARPCRPATCPTYRAKNPAPVNWEGKTLKLQLCKTSASSLDRRECRQSSEQSELDLPCKFDDLVAEIFKAHPTSSRRFKGGFKAGATSVCSRLNETLGRLDRKSVRRCRLHCEILPGCLGFRLIERDRDGSEVCLFSDRVPIDRIVAPQRSPGRSSGSEPRRIGDRQNADEAELTMYKNSGFSPADEESRIVGSRAEGAAIETQPEDVLVRPSDVDLGASDRKHVEESIEPGRNEASNRSSEDKVGEAACGCNTPFDDEARQREEDDEDEGSEPKNHPRERSLNRSNGNAVADDRGDCDDELDRTAGNEDSNEAALRKNNICADRDNVEDLAGGESAMRSNGNLTGGQKCTCSVSFDCTVDLRDRAIEADLQASGIADSHEEVAESALEDAGKDRRAKLQRTSSGSFFILKKCQPDVPTDTRLGKVACVCSSDCTCPNGSAKEHQVEECDSKCSCDSCGREDEPRLLKKTEIVRMSSLLKRRTETLDSAGLELPVTNSTQRNGALMSASDELQRGCGNDNQDEECDSKCSCDSCGREDEPRLLRETEIVRMSSLLKRRIENLDSGFQDSPDQNSRQGNEALASGSDEFQCGCPKAQSSGFRSQDLEFRRGISMKSDTRLETNATETMSFTEADSQRAQPDRGSAVQQASSATNKHPRNLSSEEHPVVSTRLSLNNAIKTMSFIEANSQRAQRAQRAQPDRSSAVQQASSATRNLSSEEHPVVSARLFLNNATKTMSFIEADYQRVQPGRGSAVQQASSATNKCSRNLSSEEHPVVSTRLFLNNATKMMSFTEADSQRAQPDRGSAVQQASSAMNKCSRNLSSEEHPVVSTRLSLNNATNMMSFIQATTERAQRAQPDRSSAVQQASSATRNLSSEEQPVVSTRLPLNNATKTMSFVEADSQRAQRSQPDRSSAVQQTSSSTNKRPRNLSAEQQPVVSTRLSLNNATKTMSFIEAGSQRVQPDRGSAVQQASSATTKRPRNGQLIVPTDNQLHIAACACPSDCTCPNRSTEETQPAECDSQCSCDTCHQEDESRPLKKSETIGMSSLLRRHTETLGSALQDPADPTSTPKNGAFLASASDEFQRDTCHQEDESRPLKKSETIRMSSLLRRHTETLGSALQDPADPTSTPKNGAFLASASDEFQRGCTKAQTSSNSSFHAQDLELQEEPSMKSASPLDTNAPKTMTFIESESPPAQPDRNPAVQRTISATRLMLFAEQPQPRDTNKSWRNVSSEERPIAASRLSRPKGRRINISIEVCPESESSSEQTRRNDRDELEGRRDATSFLKPRRHSVEPQHFERHVLRQAGKDTGGEFPGPPGSTDTGVHSPRPLETRDYLQPFRPPWSMRNPVVYGTSRTCGRRSMGKDGRSAGQGGGRRGDSCVTKNRHGSIRRNDRANDREEMPEEMSKSDAFSAWGLRKNVGHALSASSVDRMKHLIRTKLRRMLLERDKATNTPKTTLTNKKYRVSVPGGKTERSLFGRQPCRTIWESRSASDSVRTSRSFASDNYTKSVAMSEREKARKLFRSTGNPSVSTSRSRDCGAYRRFDGANSSRNSDERAPEVDSETDFQRLAGGSDFGSMRERHENLHWSEKKENQCARRSKNGGFDQKFMNHSRKEVPEEIGDCSAKNSCDASGKKMSDAKSAEFHGIIRAAGNERAPEVDSETDFPRFAGGSDFGSKTKRHENTHWSGKRENQCARQSKNGGFDEKFTNRKEVPEEIGDCSAGNSCDASGKKIPDAESAEFHGILRNERAPEVDSETDFPRLAGGSDFGSKRERHENRRLPGKRENECARQNKNGGFDQNFMSHSRKDVPEEIGDSSGRNSCDASGKKVLDESSEFHGKLDWSGNSTSRHICLFEFDRLVSSNDETESVGCCRSPRKTRLLEVRRTPRRNVDSHPKKSIVSRARDKSAMSDCSTNTNNVGVSGVRRIGAFGNIDQDLRKKLSQYVSLCKNVKYSLLKRLRPDDIYEVSRTSIPCCDRYKFGDT